MHRRKTATLHQLGVLLLSSSPYFPPNKLILKIESIYHHLTKPLENMFFFLTLTPLGLFIYSIFLKTHIKLWYMCNWWYVTSL